MNAKKVEPQHPELNTIRDLVRQMRLVEANTALERLEDEETGLSEADRLELRLQRTICSGRSGDNAKALKAAREAAEIAQALGKETSLMSALRFEGNCLLAMDEHAAAIEAFRALLKRARAAGHKREIAAAYNNLGAVYRHIDDYEQAIASFSLARRLHEESGHTEEIHIARMNLATCHFLYGELDAAESLYRELLESGAEYEDIDHTALPLWGLAGVAAKRGDLATARKHFETVIGRLEASGQSLILIEARLDWAEALADNGELDEAANLMGIIRADERLPSRPDLHARFAQLLARILEKQERFEEALHELKALRTIEHQRTQKLAQSRTDALRIIHQTERAQHLAEIEQLKNEDLARALEEADQQRHIAEEANRLKSEILKMVAHDLRNPIGNILSLLELADLDDDGPGSAEFIELAREKTRTSLRLLERLLDAAAVEEGTITIQPESIPVKAFLEDLIGSDLQAQSGQKNQQILREESDPGMVIEADPARFRQILINLFSNAIKYSPIGGTIRYGFRRESDTFILEIQDQGPGIPADQLDQIFLPFKRLKTSLPTAGESTMGLGLSIARKLARAHGGELTAFSLGLGNGSRFRLSLPQS
jgi:signal transduction histidine kinase